MYKQFLLTTFLFLQILSLPMMAQNGGRVESLKVAYLSEKLNLDPKTAEKFWPLYNQYDDEMRKVIQESKKPNDNRTAEEILDQEQKAIDIKRKYSALFLKVLSNQQLTQLFQSEKQFNIILRQRMNKIENRQERMQETPNERMQNRPRMNQAPPSSPSPQSGTERPFRRGNR